MLRTSPDDGRAHHLRGLALSKLGRAAPAEAAFARALELQPHEPELRFDHGVFLADAGQPELAIGEFGALLAVDPQNVQALLERAAVQARLGRRDAARADLEAVVVAAPGRARQVEALERLVEGRLLEALELAAAPEQEPLFREIVAREARTLLQLRADLPDADAVRARLAALGW